MNVKELIEILNKIDGNAEVILKEDFVAIEVVYKSPNSLNSWTFGCAIIR